MLAFFFLPGVVIKMIVAVERFRGERINLQLPLKGGLSILAFLARDFLKFYEVPLLWVPRYQEVLPQPSNKQKVRNRRSKEKADVSS